MPATTTAESFRLPEDFPTTRLGPRPITPEQATRYRLQRDMARSETPTGTAETVAQKFERLATQWRAETGFLSNFTKRVTHSAYLKIVGMGPAVVPILLRELQREPGHWFSALHLITEEDPIDPADAGDIGAISKAWVQWGRERGYPLGD